MAFFSGSSFSSAGWGSLDLICSFLKNLNLDVKELAAMCLSQVWRNRNSLVFKGIGRDSDFTALMAKNTLRSFREANYNPTRDGVAQS